MLGKQPFQPRFAAAGHWGAWVGAEGEGDCQEEGAEWLGCVGVGPDSGGEDPP